MWGSTYGAAGSLVILLLWIYYSSIILYFGAVFTESYALKQGVVIEPNDYAVTVQEAQIETGKKPIIPDNKEGSGTHVRPG